jgi:diaminopimelate epimerase
MNTQQINFIKIPFIKMHGLGNDFMVIDAREQNLTSSPELMMRLANRRTGVGFDQAVVLRNSDVADVFMQIINADGSEVAACGNATRCVAMHLMQNGLKHVDIETLAGVLQADYISHERVVVQMGVPKLQWQQIPLSHEMNMLAVEHNIADLPKGVAVNMGNPHLVIFVEDVENVDLPVIGATLEVSPLFPERANITIAQKLSDSHIKIRTWERGVGITQACGTAACASMVAGRILGLLEQSANVTMVGGDVIISWQGQSEQVLMEGDAAYSFYGEIMIDI